MVMAIDGDGDGDGDGTKSIINPKFPRHLVQLFCGCGGSWFYLQSHGSMCSL